MCTLRRLGFQNVYHCIDCLMVLIRLKALHTTRYFDLVSTRTQRQKTSISASNSIDENIAVLHIMMCKTPPYLAQYDRPDFHYATVSSSTISFLETVFELARPGSYGALSMPKAWVMQVTKLPQRSPSGRHQENTSGQASEPGAGEDCATSFCSLRCID
ncbi:hypothetical protein BDZ89DRAFT_1107085 [Hymenopellis radicata]|nr:hypothetical protein BDZ89DRAFT_1107085 [Hymenopellis radicata]